LRAEENGDEDIIRLSSQAIRKSPPQIYGRGKRDRTQPEPIRVLNGDGSKPTIPSLKSKYII
jgi:hypothetical protein